MFRVGISVLPVTIAFPLDQRPFFACLESSNYDERNILSFFHKELQEILSRLCIATATVLS